MKPSSGLYIMRRISKCMAITDKIAFNNEVLKWDASRHFPGQACWAPILEQNGLIVVTSASLPWSESKGYIARSIRTVRAKQFFLMPARLPAIEL